MGATIRVLAAAAVFAAACDFSWASYGIYVGKNLTADGSVFLAGYGDEPSSHWLEIVPAREWPSGATIKVGATAAARFPGVLIEIPQVHSTAKYITMNYSSFAGFPAPLTNGGLNQYLVAARDIWSPSREELQTMTPNPQTGLNYSDLARIVMERAKTAREAVEIVGELVNKYGYATYGGNSHLFADADEGWILIEFAGGRGLWAAQRLGPDDVRVSRPGYIGEIPPDYQKQAAQPVVERTALKLYEAGEPDLAAAYLTYYSNTEAMNGLRLAEALSLSIEARTKVQFGIRQPQTTGAPQ